MNNAPNSDRADWFLDEIVVPTVAEFSREIGDIRRGMLAAVVVGSLADHIFHARPTTRRGATREGDFREKLAVLSRDYAIVRDVGDAAKHAKLFRKSARLTDAQHVRQNVNLLVTNDGKLIVTNKGEAILAVGEVVVALPGGEQGLHEAIQRALTFLVDLMARN